MDKRPYALQIYIEEEQKIACSANAADHKPTYREELDAIATRADEAFERGQQVIANLTEDDLRRCRNLWEFKDKGGLYGPDSLKEWRIDSKHVLIPRYVCLIGEVRKLREILK